SALVVRTAFTQPVVRLSLSSPTHRVCSMYGRAIDAQSSMRESNDADAVLVGSRMRTREIFSDPALLAQQRLDASRQLLGEQCSGTLV
ncbi:AraC family transcriptional regulator, partial [Burkholderia pseudomallei]